ncbi:MAG: dTDP-glucose 4,6-dehydratase [Synergistaceae bacterium]|jgi:dTDP-glucose 4,6-dehydratase|nr:dTDP-glucose 4,6-dehydratase [Synergistaceae bacterium]
MSLLVTGGAGFIGSNLIHLLLSREYEVINLDKLTYAGNPNSLSDVAAHPRYHFIHGDICDGALLDRIFTEHAPRAVLNLAAESHVDRSIDAPGDFIQTNVVGTFCLLNAARGHYERLSPEEKRDFRFLQVSTDEIFGSLGESGAFSETTPCRPNSPYSASKAAADHLVRAWGHTYGLPVLTTNCSNNYGPFQFPEKLIPHMILSALKNHPLPVYGDGKNVRDWLYVADHCSALLTVLERGVPGECYNIGGNCERTNLEIVEFICRALDTLRPRDDGKSCREQVTFVQDRPGHDRRYAIDSSKIRNELGWRPEWDFHRGMQHTIEWYLRNGPWIDAILSGSYRLERRGTGEPQGGTRRDS